MHLHIPSDIRAEIVCNYLIGHKKELQFLGSHKRNAYEDILSISREDDYIKIELSRQGLYDILPEALFHPIDRFDNLPANEYKERFAEEVEEQQAEESNGRNFFAVFDKTVFNLSSIVANLKDEYYSGNDVITEIICDTLSERYKNNRFVKQTLEFIPRCQSLRGNETLISLLLRKVLEEEGLKLRPVGRLTSFEDASPRYNCDLREEGPEGALFLGNCFDENILCFDVQYWNDDFCDERFLEFVEEIRIYEDFMNDFFMGIESPLHFIISTHTSPVRLSDDICFNYLNFNVNL